MRGRQKNAMQNAVQKCVMMRRGTRWECTTETRQKLDSMSGHSPYKWLQHKDLHNLKNKTFLAATLTI